MWMSFLLFFLLWQCSTGIESCHQQVSDHSWLQLWDTPFQPWGTMWALIYLLIDFICLTDIWQMITDCKLTHSFQSHTQLSCWNILDFPPPPEPSVSHEILLTHSIQGSLVVGLASAVLPALGSVCFSCVDEHHRDGRSLANFSIKWTVIHTAIHFMI